MIGTNDFFSCHINFSISTIWTLFTDYLHFVEKRKLIFWLYFAHFLHRLCTARCMWSVRCKENSGFYQLNASLTVHSTIKTVWILHQFDSLKCIRLKAVVTSIQKCGSSIAHRWKRDRAIRVQFPFGAIFILTCRLTSRNSSQYWMFVAIFWSKIICKAFANVNFGFYSFRCRLFCLAWALFAFIELWYRAWAR